MGKNLRDTMPSRPKVEPVEDIPLYAESDSIHAIDEPPAYPGLPSHPEEAVAVHRPSGPQFREQPRWLKINLLVCKITVFIMAVVAVVNITFAGVVMEDLRGDYNDYDCESHYIAEASEPWDEDFTNMRVGQGRYHTECQRLLQWTYVITVAASASMVRPWIQFLPANAPTKWSIQYTQGSSLGRKFSPSRIYAFRAIFSLVPFVLYFAGTLILALSPVTTGPKAEDSYHDMLLISLALLTLSALATGQQVFATGIASWVTRGWKRPEI